jgi:protein tyrosine phosphatase
MKYIDTVGKHVPFRYMLMCIGQVEIPSMYMTYLELYKGAFYSRYIDIYHYNSRYHGKATLPGHIHYIETKYLEIHLGMQTMSAQEPLR